MDQSYQRVSIGAKKLGLNLNHELEILYKLFLKVMFVRYRAVAQNVAFRRRRRHSVDAFIARLAPLGNGRSCLSRLSQPSSIRPRGCVQRRQLPEVASIMERGGRDPRSLDVDDAIRYAFLMRCWANQWWKQLRLYEQGALAERDWEKLAQEAAQALSSRGGKMFRERNHVFEDLYVEIDKYERIQISDFAIGRHSENDA